MASLLPLLHDILPIFLPGRPVLHRGTDVPAVEQRAELPPWYQSSPREDTERSTPFAATSGGITAVDISETPSGTEPLSNPIQLFGHEEAPAATAFARLVGQKRSLGPRVLRQDVMVSVTDKMSLTILTVQPRSASSVHHHGEQDAIVYATSGHGVLLVGPSLDAVKALKADLKGEQVTGQEEQPGRIELGPGDSVFIPAWTEIQAVNEGLEGDVGWVVVRAGSGDPVQVDLDGWGGQRLE